MDFYTFFSILLNMSITASVVILFVLLLRLLLRKAPKVISYALWGLVLFRLLCPVAIQSDLSLFRLVDTPVTRTGTMSSMEYIPSDIVPTRNPSVTFPVAGTAEEMNGHLPQGGEQPAADLPETALIIAAYVWAAGVLAMAIYALASYLRLRRRLLTASPLRDNIYLADEIPSPFVMGLIRPKIYLPSSLGEREQTYILMHEQHHIRRCDHIIKALAFAALCIHWFNPLVWAAFHLAGRDMEMSCDEAVVKKLGPGILADYAASLLSFATGRHMMAGMPLTFGEGDPKGRIRNLAGWKKPSFWVILAAIAAVVILALCLMTNPKAESFQLGILVPAGSKAAVVYADEEISPLGNEIIISCGEGLGDTAVSLKPVEGNTKAAYEPVYLTPGMPVKIKAEKGAWFKIGVDVQNDRDEDRTVYVNVENVHVRIAGASPDNPAANDLAANDPAVNDSAGLEQYRTDYLGDAPRVSQIAQRLPYPQDYRYSSIELQTDEEPYELMVRLSGEDSVEREDFAQAASLAFEYIGNLGVISFWREGAEEPMESFTREEAEEALGSFAREDVEGSLESFERDNTGDVLFSDILLGNSGFYYAVGGEVETLTVNDVPGLFDQEDPYMKVWEFSAVDLNGDGEKEVILFVTGASGDAGGKVILHRIGDRVYGYLTDARTLVELKTDGTYEFSDPTGVTETGVAVITGFSETGYSVDKITYAGGTYEGWNTFVVEHQAAAEEDYLEALEQQSGKQGATRYDFTGEMIEEVF